MTEFQKKYRGLLGDGEDGYIDYDGIQSLIKENEKLKAELEEGTTLMELGQLLLSRRNKPEYKDWFLNKEIDVLREKLKKEQAGEDPTIAWVVDLMHEHDYRMQDAEFFYTEEEARRFVDAISDPKANLNNCWVATNCYEIKKSKMSKSAYDSLKKHGYLAARPTRKE